jgi:hypothetical protein
VENIEIGIRLAYKLYLGRDKETSIYMNPEFKKWLEQQKYYIATYGDKIVHFEYSWRWNEVIIISEGLSKNSPEIIYRNWEL